MSTIEIPLLHDNALEANSARRQRELVAEFDSSRQTRRLLFKGFIRWLGTAIFVTFVLVTLKIYQDKGIIASAQKVTFNSIATALGLGLGINFFEAFKDLAKILRWWILAREEHTIREADLILGLENLTNVVKLGWGSRARLWTLSFCIIWVFLNLLAQTSIALINLTYSLNDGQDQHSTYTRPGTVHSPNLTCYFGGGARGKFCREKPENYLSAAHAYGELVRSAPCLPYNDISDIYSSQVKAEYYCRKTPGRQEFAYRFSDYNPDDNLRNYPLLTNRVITASSGLCHKYTNVTFNATTDETGDTAWRYQFSNDTFHDSLVIPQLSGDFDGTTYIYRAINVPSNATTWSCGPRCMWIWAHRNPGVGQGEAFYQCPVTVNDVFNPVHKEHLVSDDMARLAASAIGLSGRPSGTQKNKQWNQYQYYPYGTSWEIHFAETDHVGANMAEFAIGSLANLANSNPQIPLEGVVPYLGSRLQVFWPYTIALCVGILGLHLLLFLSTIIATKGVVIKDDSNLSTARLLRPLVDDVGSGASLLSGKKLGRIIQRNRVGGIVYGPRQNDGSNDHSLELSRGIPTVQARKHPNGKYS